MANLNATYDVEIALTANAFTRADNAFGGWATSATGAAVYSDAVKVINLSAENGATVTLYVAWIQVQKSGSAAVVTVTTDTVSDDAADQLVAAAKEMKNAGTQNVTVDVNATATDSVSISSDSVKEAVDAGIGVDIATKNGSMEFSSAALSGKIPAGTTLKSEIKNVAIPAAYADKVPADTKVFSTTLTAGDTAITQFGGVFTVKVAYQATENTDDLYVAYLAADGTLQKMESHYENGFMVFTTDHLSDYAVLTESGSSGSGNTLVIVIAIVVAVLVIGAVVAVVFIKKKKA
jgi:cobalamin biosynthesis Mg chelatase CobN